MALYRPTNIIPNLIIGNAEGTVDANDDLAVTWQINGSSAMTSYKIKIVDSTSTTVYNQTLSVGCPAYGRNNLGEIVPFTYVIPHASLSGFANNKQYRLSLTLSSGNTTVDTVTVAFQTAASPKFTTSGYSKQDPATYTITTREKNFSFLIFSDSSLQWFRWILSINDGTVNTPVAGEVLFDTGNIFGSGDMTFDYSGFVNGYNYALQCIACDRYGREATSRLYGFEARYNEVNMQFPITVSPSKSRSAIKVEWTGAFSIIGKPTGKYSINANNHLVLPSIDDYVTWDEVSEAPMTFPTPWTVIYQGRLRKDNATLWEIKGTSSARHIRLRYVFSTRTLVLEQGSTILFTYTSVWWESTISTILTMPEEGTAKFYLRINYMTGGLYPSDTLYPGTNLYPSGEIKYAVRKHEQTLTGVTLTNIKGIVTYGKQYCYFIEEITSDDEVIAELVELMYNNKISEPPMLGDLNFFATFEADLQAGSLYFLGHEISGWAIYRQEEDATIAKQIAILPIGATGFYDYSACTDGTKYYYKIAPIFVDEGEYTDGSSIRSDQPLGILNPNYSIIECEYSEVNKCYIAKHEYDFGKNIKSGSVSNNNSPNVLANFTRYPTVQLSPQNYKSGSLTSLIGVIALNSDSQIEYSDNKELREALFALSTTTNPLFLKTRKGDVLKIRIAAAISATIMDETYAQAQEISIPWVEIGNGNNMYVLSYDNLAHDGDAYIVPQENPIVPSGEVTITENGQYVVRQFAEAKVNVPNTYTAADQGKVVSGNFLIDQINSTVSDNGVYDTTIIKQLTVQVPSADGVEF